MGDGVVVLLCLWFEGVSIDVDVVLGFDINLMGVVVDIDLFVVISVEVDYDLLVVWDDVIFVLFDWGYFVFVVGIDVVVLLNFCELVDSDLKIVI